MFTFSAFNLLWFYHFEKVNILILTHNILYRQNTADIDVYNEGASSSADVTASLTSTQCIATQPEETFCSTAVEQSSNGQNLEAEIEEIINSDYAGNVEIDMELDSENSTSSSESDESEEEEYKKDSEIPESESVPLYVLSLSDSIYSSEITHKEHLLSLCAFSTKNHLSRTAFQQLLKLIDIHLPEKNLCETSVNKIKEKVGFHGSYFQCHEYCDTCGALYPNDKLIHQCTTPRCTGMRCDTKDGKSNYFVSGDMRTQLKEILENEENWNEVTSSLQRTKKDEIYDILDGRKYQELKSKCKDMTVTLTMFTDGVSLFKSSKVSLWPVYLVVNELSPYSRFLKKNMILWGLWQGQGKPKMNTFFFPFVKEMRTLYNEGLSVETIAGKQTIYIITNALTMDLQARACVFNMMQHNGLCACIFCEETGVVVKSGKGHTRSFPYREIKPKARTSESIDASVEQAVQQKKPVCGFHGRSILKHLPWNEFHVNCTIDYMHGFLLGILKRMMTLWIDGSSFEQPYFIGHKLKEIDKTLKNIKTPYIIHRTPRKIQNNLNHWKASEFRSFLLYYGIPCVEGILPNSYLEHFACLVEATFLLLQEKITAKDLKRCKKLLDVFYKCMAPLYGEETCGLNVHNLSHIVECVENWGPLWAYSCFSFESFNGEISKAIHGKGNVSGEVYWAVHSEKILENEIKSLPHGKAKDLLKEIMSSRNTPNNENLEVGEQCYVMKPLVKMNIIPPSLAKEISIYLKIEEDKLQRIDIFKAVKIQRNRFVFYSKQCGRVKQNNSYTVLLQQPINGCDIVQVEYFIHISSPRKTIGVCSGFQRVHSLVKGRAPHTQVLELKR